MSEISIPVIVFGMIAFASTVLAIGKIQYEAKERGKTARKKKAIENTSKLKIHPKKGRRSF